MNNTPDQSLANFTEICGEFASFLANHGKASEADTRVKLIDRILKEVLFWPESSLSREDHVASGYTDYQLHVRNRTLVVVEAKREGEAFILPKFPQRTPLSLKGAILTHEPVRDAIFQVRSYCDDVGAKFAIASNGDSWIVFRAIRDDMPWKSGKAKLFPSSEYIAENFVEFWNLLSFDAVCNGALELEFSELHLTPRRMFRVVSTLFNADLPIGRNRLHAQLQPFIRYIFEDIASQDNADLLNSCYVHTKSLRVVSEDLNVVITDAMPKELRESGGVELEQSAESAGKFEESMARAMRTMKGALYLLLGGIGSGKTTFLRRYQRLLARDFLREHALVFHLDFLQAPLTVDDMETFVWRTILDTIRTEYLQYDLEARKKVKSIFKAKLSNLEHAGLRGIKKHTEAYESAIDPHLLEWQKDLAEYVPALLRYSSVYHKRSIVVFVDNVDQLDPSYQAKIFLLAQRTTRVAGCVTVIALREESYYTPSIQSTFTAYTSHKFHIASPQFKEMIKNRIEFAIQAIENKPEMLPFSFYGHNFDPQDICDFLRIVEHSVLMWSHRITRFIECICFGNMRSALQMFTTFLTSGATDVDKMLSIYRRDGKYNVAFHEFLKSVMLQDRAYYREEQSPIFNLFNCTTERGASHFTSLRILSFLLAYRGQSSFEGRGYVEISRLIGAFSDLIDNVRDVVNTLDRLLARQLIEVNTRATQTVTGASHIRVTAAGWYYFKVLCESFAYLDLVLQDTPLDNSTLERDLRDSVYQVNNLADREHEKLARMQVRFDRTQRFLDYLSAEEKKELIQYNLDRGPRSLSVEFMPRVQSNFQQTRAYIERRLAQGRLDDIPFQQDFFPSSEFDILVEPDELGNPADTKPELDSVDSSTDLT